MYITNSWKKVKADRSSDKPDTLASIVVIMKKLGIDIHSRMISLRGFRVEGFL